MKKRRFDQVQLRNFIEEHRMAVINASKVSFVDSEFIERTVDMMEIHANIVKGVYIIKTNGYTESENKYESEIDANFPHNRVTKRFTKEISKKLKSRIVFPNSKFAEITYDGVQMIIESPIISETKLDDTHYLIIQGELYVKSKWLEKKRIEYRMKSQQ